MIPFEPEALTLARARFHRAIANPIDPDRDRPGLDRRNVFDFADGLRLIVSRDPMPGHPRGPRIHISASLHPGSDLDLECERVAREDSGRGALLRLVAAAGERFWELAPGQGDLHLIAVSPEKGIPHLIVDREPGED